MNENQPQNEFEEIGDRIRKEIEDLNRNASTFEIASLTGLLCVAESFSKTERVAAYLGNTTKDIGVAAVSKASSLVNTASEIWNRAA